MQSTLESPRLVQLEEALNGGDTLALETFWREVEERGAPLVEPLANDEGYVLVTFLWKDAGDTRNVVVFNGPASRAKPIRNQFIHLSKTDIWYKTYRTRSDMRTWYSFSHNDPLDFDFVEDWGKREMETFRADPLNPRRFAPYGDNCSILELPAAPLQPWLEVRSDVPKGDVKEHRITSHVLGNERSVWVYTPAEYTAERPHRLLVLLDGQIYLHDLSATVTVDNLIAAKKLPPFIVVFVESLWQTRLQELNCSQAFVDFLTQELLPWLEGSYLVTTDPLKTIIGGFSIGGIAAAFAGLRASQRFGNVLAQSGAFWSGPDWHGQDGEDTSNAEWLTRQVAQAPRLPLHFYLEAGLLEYGDDPFKALLVANRHLRDVLQAKGYEFHYNEFNGGHDMVCWRGSLANGLLDLAG